VLIVAVLSGHKIGKTTWQPEARIRSLALFGGVDLDFRQATLPENGVRMSSCNIFGGTKITVPKGMAVTVSGFSLFGGKEVKNVAMDAGRQPPLRISAFTLFGGLEVKGEEG